MNSLRPTDALNRDFRTKRLAFAVGSSIASKLMTALVQIVGLPVAAIALGPSGFSLYAMLAAATGWLMLTNIGVGPTLTIKLAEATALHDLDEQQHLFSTAVTLTLITSAVASVLAVVAVWTTPVNLLFGAQHLADQSTIRYGLTSLVGFFFIQTTLGILESAQSAYQRQHVVNIFSAAAGIPCLVALTAVAKFAPNPVALIWAMNAPVIAFRIIGAVTLFREQRHLELSTSRFRMDTAKRLLRRGAMYTLAGTLGHFLAHMLPIIIVGRVLVATDSAAFAATMQAFLLLSGIITMLVIPLRPAITDSVMRGDRAWGEAAYKRALLGSLIFSGSAAVALAAIGPQVFQLWFRGHLEPNRILLACSGLYLLACTWESVHFAVLVALDRIHTASMLLLARTIGGALATALLTQRFGVATPFAAMTLAIALVSALAMRRQVLSSFQRLNRATIAGHHAV